MAFLDLLSLLTFDPSQSWLSFIRRTLCSRTVQSWTSHYVILCRSTCMEWMKMFRDNRYCTCVIMYKFKYCTAENIGGSKKAIFFTKFRHSNVGRTCNIWATSVEAPKLYSPNNLFSSFTKDLSLQFYLLHVYGTCIREGSGKEMQEVKYLVVQ